MGEKESGGRTHQVHNCPPPSTTHGPAPMPGRLALPLGVGPSRLTSRTPCYTCEWTSIVSSQRTIHGSLTQPWTGLAVPAAPTDATTGEGSGDSTGANPHRCTSFAIRRCRSAHTAGCSDAKCWREVSSPSSSARAVAKLMQPASWQAAQGTRPEGVAGVEGEARPGTTKAGRDRLQAD